MAESLLTQAMSPEVLDISWRRLRNEHTPWSESVTRDQLQQHFVKHLLECREEVLQGRYRPAALRKFPLKKPDGRQRVLSAQYLRDKLVQRAVLTVLEPKAEALFHEDSFAYRPNRSVALALNKANERIRCGQDWLVDADIKSFFDQIPQRPLLKKLKSFVSDSAAMKLIDQWIKQGTHHNSLLSTRRGISQGAILSPLFCNLYLHSFDLALSEANIPFVRFADDFLLFATTREGAVNAQGYAAKELERLGLQLNAKKTQVVRSNPKVIFLGQPLPKPSR